MKELKLNQDAYIFDNGNETYYAAQAIDANNSDDDDYEVRWEMLDTYDIDDTDESNACDWDKFSVYVYGRKIGDNTTYKLI